MGEAFFAYLEREKNVRLNEEQRAAVDFGEGIALLAAAPGSGKTTVAVCRAERLLEMGVPAQRLLTVSFGRRSREDLQARFCALFPESPSPVFSTLHALSLRVLREAAQRAGRPLFGILSDPGPMVRGLLRRQGVFPDAEMMQEALSLLEREASAPDEERYAAPLFDGKRLAADYAREKREKRLMDFADMQVYALRLLRRDEGERKRWQGRYAYVQVDEAQDTSPVQQALLALLVQACGNLLCVGDADQSIYGFRGARPEFLNDFERCFPGARVMALPVNFRSRPEIVEAAGRLIRYNPGRRDIRMRSARKAGGCVERVELCDWEEQADYVCRRARDLIPGRTLGVLYRNNSSAVPLCDVLLRRGVPFALQGEGMERFPGSGHLMLDLLRLALCPGDAQALLGAKEAIAPHLPLRVLREIPPQTPDCLEALLRRPEMPEEMREDLRASRALLARVRRMKSLDAIEALVEHYELMDRRFDPLRLLARREEEIPGLLRRAREVPELAQNTSDPRAALRLSTIHAAKGLEWDEVILLDGKDGLLPPIQALKMEDRVVLQEETRLLYVAVTRARERFSFLCAERMGGLERPASRYLERLLDSRREARERETALNLASHDPELHEMGLAAHKPLLRLTREYDKAMDRIALRRKSGARGRERALGLFSARPHPVHLGKEPIRSLAPGEWIFHERFGKGKVVSVGPGSHMRVRFDGEERVLDAALCLRQGLLHKCRD